MTKFGKEMVEAAQEIAAHMRGEVESYEVEVIADKRLTTTSTKPITRRLSDNGSMTQKRNTE